MTTDSTPVALAPAAVQGFATIPRSMLHDPEIHRDAKLVYLVLSSHAGGKRSAWPSHRRIGELVGLSVSSVKVRLAWLRQHGYIEWERRATDDGAQLSNSYILLAGSADGGPTNIGSHHPARGSQEAATPSRDTATGLAVERPPLAVAKLGGSQEAATNKSQLNEGTSSSAKPPTQEVIDLCGQLADRIEANGSRRPTIGKGWHDACRLMIERDDREPAKIRAAIDWCQADEFWRSVILSMPKLREKYDQLSLAARRTGSRTGPVVVDRIAAGRAAGIPEAWQ